MNAKLAYKKRKKIRITDRFDTGSEHRHFNIKEWHDLSGEPDFLKEGYKPGTKELIRLTIHDSVEWSNEAEKNREKFKEKMLEENHTNRPHNMRRAPRDTEHDWTVKTTIPHHASKCLIDVSYSTPWYAQTGYYFLSTLCGMSWY
jgi:hypothetical protein